MGWRRGVAGWRAAGGTEQEEREEQRVLAALPT